MSLLSSLQAPTANWVLNAIILLAIVGIFFYLRAKAKNQATKEDIAALTITVESIKSSYAVFIENIKARHLLRMVALEKRLATHQEAYALLSKAAHRRGKNDFEEHIFQAQEWWRDNCLYLEPQARNAFFIATNQLFLNNDLIHTPGRKQVEIIQATWADVEKAFSLIIEGVDLPPIKGELDALKPPEQGP